MDAQQAFYIFVPVCILLGLILAAVILKRMIKEFVQTIHEGVNTVVENLQLLTSLNMGVAQHLLPADKNKVSDNPEGSKPVDNSSNTTPSTNETSTIPAYRVKGSPEAKEHAKKLRAGRDKKANLNPEELEEYNKQQKEKEKQRNRDRYRKKKADAEEQSQQIESGETEDSQEDTPNEEAGT